jgi:hypothetical protein
VMPKTASQIKLRASSRRDFCQPQTFGLNENHSFRSYGFSHIAGAGLEPATFGL